MPTLNFLKLCGWPIWRQLMLEEALLRCDQRSWFIWNEDAEPAIVLGMSNQLEQLVDVRAAYVADIPIFRRFSAGGTVVVDQHTKFVSWIMQHHDLPELKIEPNAILQWCGSLISPLGISVNGQDFVLNNRKVAGNAQYIRGARWLHHSSFLWRYSRQLMNLLAVPSKQPAYRQGRAHNEFCAQLSDHLINPDCLLETILASLARTFVIQQVTEEQVSEFLGMECRRSTQQLLLQPDGTYRSLALEKQGPHKVVLANSGPT